MNDGDEFRTTPPPRDNPLLTFALDHLALLIPIIGALIFAFRCVIVSGGDPYVASMLVTATSVGDAIRALLFAVVPTLFFVSAFFAALVATNRLMRGGWRNYKTLGIGIAAAALSVALSVGWIFLSGESIDAANLFVATSLPIFSAVPVAFELRNRREGELRGRTLGVALILLLNFVLFVLLLLGPSLGGKNFWLPRERLDFQDGDPFTGYVLKESGDYVVILNDAPRVIVQKPKDALEDRDFCYPEDHTARSSKLAPDAPVCP